MVTIPTSYNVCSILSAYIGLFAYEPATASRQAACDLSGEWTA